MVKDLKWLNSRKFEISFAHSNLQKNLKMNTLFGNSKNSKIKITLLKSCQASDLDPTNRYFQYVNQSDSHKKLVYVLHHLDIDY